MNLEQLSARAPLNGGDLVRVNPRGASRFPAYSSREGVVVSKSIYPSAVRLKWSHMVTIVTMNARYLERVE